MLVVVCGGADGILTLEHTPVWKVSPPYLKVQEASGLVKLANTCIACADIRLEDTGGCLRSSRWDSAGGEVVCHTYPSALVVVPLLVPQYQSVVVVPHQPLLLSIVCISTNHMYPSSYLRCIAMCCTILQWIEPNCSAQKPPSS